MKFAERPTIFAVDDTLRAIVLDQHDASLLQRFFEDNPEYFFICNGRAPVANEALQEILSEPPAEMSYSSKWALVVVDATNNIVAFIAVLSDLIATHVWNVGLFIVATSLHGSGKAQLIYQKAEQWMRHNDAQWIRLGVIKGNGRAERFWEQTGFIEVRKRHDVAIGLQIHTLRVMVKSLNQGLLSDYLLKVVRDRPE